jgi:hypothetical protein
MQCPEIMYRWDKTYPLGKGPLDRIKGSRILEVLKQYARDHKMFDHVRFRTEVVTVKEEDDGWALPISLLDHSADQYLHAHI